MNGKDKALIIIADDYEKDEEQILQQQDMLIRLANENGISQENCVIIMADNEVGRIQEADQEWVAEVVDKIKSVNPSIILSIDIFALIGQTSFTTSIIRNAALSGCFCMTISLLNACECIDKHDNELLPTFQECFTQLLASVAAPDESSSMLAVRSFLLFNISFEKNISALALFMIQLFDAQNLKSASNISVHDLVLIKVKALWNTLSDEAKDTIIQSIDCCKLGFSEITNPYKRSQELSNKDFSAFISDIVDDVQSIIETISEDDKIDRKYEFLEIYRFEHVMALLLFDDGIINSFDFKPYEQELSVRQFVDGLGQIPNPNDVMYVLGLVGSKHRPGDLFELSLKKHESALIELLSESDILRAGCVLSRYLNMLLFVRLVLGHIDETTQTEIIKRIGGQLNFLPAYNLFIEEHINNIDSCDDIQPPTLPVNLHDDITLFDVEQIMEACQGDVPLHVNRIRILGSAIRFSNLGSIRLAEALATSPMWQELSLILNNQGSNDKDCGESEIKDIDCDQPILLRDNNKEIELPVSVQPNENTGFTIPDDLFTNKEKYLCKSYLNPRILRDFVYEEGLDKFKKIINVAVKEKFIENDQNTVNCFIAAISGLSPDPDIKFSPVKLKKTEAGYYISRIVQCLCTKPMYKVLNTQFILPEGTKSSSYFRPLDNKRGKNWLGTISFYYKKSVLPPGCCLD